MAVRLALKDLVQNLFSREKENNPDFNAPVDVNSTDHEKETYITFDYMNFDFDFPDYSDDPDSIWYYHYFPTEALNNLSKFAEVLEEESQQLVGEDRGEWISYAFQHIANKLQPEGRALLYRHFNYSPDKPEEFLSQFDAAASVKNDFITQAEDYDAAVNGFAATDIPAPKFDPLEFLTDLQNRVTYHKQKDESYLYVIDDRKLFVDRGPQITMAEGASDDEEAILLALHLAQRKFGNSIELTGTETFKRRAIEIMVKHNVDVKLKNPSQFALLEEAKKRKSTEKDDSPEVDLTPGKTVIGTPTPKSAIPSFEPVEHKPFNPAQATQPVSPVSEVPTEIDRYTGILMEHGTAPYQHNPDNSDSYFARLKLTSGEIATYWGIELEGALEEAGAKVSDIVRLDHLGRKPVTINVPIRDAAGNVIGHEEKEGWRNEWKAKVISNAPAISIPTAEIRPLQEKIAQILPNHAEVKRSVAKTLSELQFTASHLHFNSKAQPLPGDLSAQYDPAPTTATQKMVGGTPVFSSLEKDPFRPSIALFEGNGQYFQGFASVAGQFYNVIVPLAGNGALRIYATQTDGKPLLQIGSALNIVENKEEVPGTVYWNINGNTVESRFHAGAMEKFGELLSGILKPASQKQPDSLDANNVIALEISTHESVNTKSDSRMPVKDALSKTYLAVPFAEKDAAKAAGAKWDKERGSWYFSEGQDAAPFVKWLAKEQSGPISYHELQDKFAAILTSHGAILQNGHPIMDGMPHRIPVEGDKGKEVSGKYQVHFDGNPAGWFKNYRTDDYRAFRDDSITLSKEEQAAFNAQAEAAREARTAARNARYEERATEMQQKLARLSPVGTDAPTEYLSKKQIAPTLGIYTDRSGSMTYIPAMDVNGKVWSIQYIPAEGEKVFASDTTKIGCFHPVGGMKALEDAPILIIAEGYSTAASIAEVAGHATVAAFDCNNLLHVAQRLRERFPDKPVIIAGDDDEARVEKLGYNPGRDAATAAAAAVNGIALFPEFTLQEKAAHASSLTDFNDLAVFCEAGKRRLQEQLDYALSNIHRIIPTDSAAEPNGFRPASAM